ncbi:LsdA family protein [Calocera viscosa TUFC12733]|uniref:LsdA family protein n=1 Tax=Calocera viscosa (strain TUFC12733) TaxID=1330018 RepID=A0A167SD15_CALVF|nr:LsdA family protein [Calocera viscosa TUFC12733]
MRLTLVGTAIFGLTALSAWAAPLAVDNIKRDNDPLPFPDGFPTPSDAQLQKIYAGAHGTLSNSAPPANVSYQGLVNLRLLDFAERIEAVYFYEFLWNVTNGVPGYELPWWVDYDYFVRFLTVTLHVEELHNLDAVTVLAHFNQTAIEPCTTYHFPVSNFEEAVTLAMTFTSNVFGLLGEIVQIFAQNGDIGLTRHIVQVVANEGEQNGFFRYLLGRVPDELPFTTVSTREFSFTALQGFVDPASCPNIDLISQDINTFDALTLLVTPKARTEEISFAIAIDKYVDGTNYYVVYTNQGNNPVVEPATWVASDSTTVTLNATFPYHEYLLNGLTIAAVTDQAGPFADVDSVTAAAIWAPAFIVVN